MTDTATLFIRHNSVLFSEIGEDVVALNVGRGECFGMEEASADVWRLLAQPMSLSDLCRELQRRYEVEPDRCLAEISDLIDTMRADGLVITADGRA